MRPSNYSHGERSHRLMRATFGFATLWFAWVLLQFGFSFFRGLGDNITAPHNVQRLEEAIFVVSPSEWLQANLYARGVVWLDFFSFAAHGFWFGLPFAFGIILMIYRRGLLLEFLLWTSVVSYVCVAVFLIFPVDPPWMHVDVVRILSERNFVDYTTLDNNPSAAFPSMHAALPATMALFFFCKWPERRFYAYLSLFFAIAIGFAVVYLGEHWVVDVVAGYAVAGVTAILCANRRLVAAYRRVPGDPVGNMARLNRWFFEAAPAVDGSGALAGEGEPEPVPRAA